MLADRIGGPNESCGGKDTKPASVVHFELIHWREPVRNALEPLEHSTHPVQAKGETQNADLNELAYIIATFHSGIPLDQLERRIEGFAVSRTSGTALFYLGCDLQNTLARFNGCSPHGSHVVEPPANERYVLPVQDNSKTIVLRCEVGALIRWVMVATMVYSNRLPIISV